MNINDFKKYIKIGIQTKGYEDFVGNNLLLRIGFLGRCTSNSTTRFKIKTDDVIKLIGNKGIKLIKPIKYSSEYLAGLDWTLKFKENKILKPEDSIMYTDTKGNVNIKFTDYTNQTHEIKSDISEDPELNMMNVEKDLDNLASDDLLDLACSDEDSFVQFPIAFERGITKILYPKELEISITDIELIQLERDLLTRQIKA